MNKSKPDQDRSPAGKGSKKRLLLFKLIGLLIPFLVLFLLELSLRLFHYGHDLRLFIEYPGDNNFLVLNPAASGRYFANQENATTGNIELFKKKKEEGTLRIFVLGESTTIGYPYFHNGSFHRWLLYRLTHEFPDKTFEIVNLSLTAVNSYTVSGFAKELVNYEPDAVLIYTGHNEYYGALGVGSTDKSGAGPTITNIVLWLRQFRLTQLLTNLFDKIAALVHNRRDNSGKRRMEVMVADQQIPYGSELFNRGIDQFRSNMEETLRLFERRKIPVFFSNLVSNEKDLRPFISLPIDSARYPGFIRDYSSGLAALQRHDTAAAYSAFKEADHVYNGHALCNYYLGRLVYKQGNFGQAKIYLSKAKNLDALRFRAPDTINTIIGQLCGKYKNTFLVDTKKAFEAASPNGIIGAELILEHVHPNLNGYALMSGVFYERMKEQGLFNAHEKEISFRQLRQDMPVTKVDSLLGVYKVFYLKRSWPFRDTSLSVAERRSLEEFSLTDSTRTRDDRIDSLFPVTMEEQLAYDLTLKHADWADVMDGLYNYYIGRQDWSNAKRVVETLILEHPTEEPYYEKTANLCGMLKDDEMAAFYFRKSFSLSPSFEKARKIFVLYLRLNRPAAAIPYLDYAIQNNVSGLNLAPVRRIAGEILQLQNTLARDTANLSVRSRIADKYAEMGINNRAGKTR